MTEPLVAPRGSSLALPQPEVPGGRLIARDGLVLQIVARIPNVSDLSTPSEACRIPGVDRGTVLAWGHAGRIRMHRLGKRGSYRYERAEIEAHRDRTAGTAADEASPSET